MYNRERGLGEILQDIEETKQKDKGKREVRLEWV
jgi:hypothetical protein